MAIIHVQIDDELNQKFRIAIYERFEGRRGGLRRAVEEAINLWLEEESIKK